MRISRSVRSAIAGVVTFVPLAAARAAEPASQPVPPHSPRTNIVLIVADDLGYGELGCYGGKDVPTPHIDSIAAAGVRFTNGYVTCPVCAPTRCGLLTGRYQQRFGFENNPGPEQAADPNYGLPAAPILPERLKAAGYATGMVGKWHLGYRADSTPARRGFDSFFGFLGGASSYVGSRTLLRGDQAVPGVDYNTDAFASEATTFIDRHAAGPFFLYLPFNAVHAPLQAPQRYLDRFANIGDEKRRTYAAMQSAMDDAVGAVLESLRSHQLDDRTLVIFISDNGGPTRQTTSSNAPLRGFKGGVYEGGIRIPCMMRFPGVLPAGKAIDDPVISLDVVPTVLRAARITAPDAARLEGVDLIAALRDASVPQRPLFWKFGRQWAVRDGRWKLMQAAESASPELYDLSADIGEQHDLAAEQPERVKQLTALWDEWNAGNQDAKWGQRGRSQATPATQPSTQPAPPNAPVAGRDPMRRFRQLDRNNDGKLTPDEFDRPRRFRDMDRNNDGAITPDEAAAGFAPR
jgi:arylsulfatase A-like enzyme